MIKKKPIKKHAVDDMEKAKKAISEDIYPLKNPALKTKAKAKKK